MILGEIGGIHRFPNYSMLLAFAGLDPTVRQSGKFNAASGRSLDKELICSVTD